MNGHKLAAIMVIAAIAGWGLHFLLDNLRENRPEWPMMHLPNGGPEFGGSLPIEGRRRAGDDGSGEE